MAYFKSVRDNGSRVVIDDSFKMRQFSGKGSVNASTQYGSQTNIKQASVTVNGVNPFIAVSCASPVGLLKRTQSGSSFTFTLLVNSTSAVEIGYFIFDDPAVFNSTFGMKLKNAANVFVFDALQPMMRVIAPLAYSTTGSFTTTYPSGKTYAVALGLNSPYLIVVGGPIGGPDGGTLYVQSLTMHMTSLSGNSVTVATVVLNQRTVSAAGPPIGNPNCYNLLIDVTNY